jgi:F1F0 ATPase subunit 2
VTLFFSGLAGLAIGAVFYGGLWFTVRRGLTSKKPALWFLASSLVRTPLVLFVFFVAAHRDWERLAACLAGYLVARLIVTRIIGPVHGSQIEPVGKAPHAA